MTNNTECVSVTFTDPFVEKADKSVTVKFTHLLLKKLIKVLL